MSGSQEAASSFTGRTESGSEKNNLTESEELTSATASVSDDENISGALVGGWFGDIKSLAQSTKNTLIPGIQAIGSVIHNSAMAVAAEIAQLERDADGMEWRDGDVYSESTRPPTVLRLPWEVLSSDDKLDDWIDDEALKAKMFSMSTEESTFLRPYSTADDACSDEDTEFRLDAPRIHLIRRLLDLDHNLASLHAKLSGRSDVEEATFWKNYFHHCERVRQAHVQILPLSKSENDDDDDAQSRSTLGSLVPAGDSVTGGGGEDNSYVCVRNPVMSPPSSLNTLGTISSVGEMVLVQTPSGADSGDEL